MPCVGFCFASRLLCRLSRTQSFDLPIIPNTGDGRRDRHGVRLSPSRVWLVLGASATSLPLWMHSENIEAIFKVLNYTIPFSVLVGSDWC